VAFFIPMILALFLAGDDKKVSTSKKFSAGIFLSSKTPILPLIGLPTEKTFTKILLTKISNRYPRIVE
jgi:hypothetical protein